MEDSFETPEINPVENETKKVFDEIYEEAMENFDLAKTAWSEIHNEFISDKEFVLGKQWDSQILSQRIRDKKTSKVFDNCAKYVRYVVNSSLKNSPAIKVNPKDKNKKKESEAISGIIRRIESDSNAKEVYSAAFADAVAGGIGIFEICVYQDDEENPIKIKKIIDPCSIYLDPNAIEPDFSDASFAIRVKKINKKKFKKLYPDKECNCLIEKNKDWFENDDIQVIEYWKKEKNVVDWYICNGNEIIDSSILYGGYAGKYLPFATVLGEDFVVNGERHIKSIIRDIKDRQIYYNFINSETIDFISRSSQAGWLLTEKTAEKYLDIYQDPTKNNSVLVYPSNTEKPVRIEAPQAPTAYLQEMTRLDNEMRSAVGIRDPFQDIPSTQSGKALKLELGQQNLATALWTDHLNCAIKYAGRVIADLILKFYNFPHEQEIIGIDGQLSTASIQTPDENGEMLDLTGEYYVTISTGASYQDQQEATFEKLLELYKANPQMMSVGADLLVRNLDVVESETLADRLYAMLPPQIQSLNKDTQDPKMMMMQMKQQMDEMGKVLEQTTQALTQKTQEANQLNEMISNKQNSEMQKIEMQNQNKLQTEVMSNQSAEQQIAIKGDYDMKLKEMELQYQLRMKELELEIEKIKAIQIPNISIP